MLQWQDKVRIGRESLHVDMLTARGGRDLVSLARGLSDNLIEGKTLDLLLFSFRNTDL